MPFWPCPCCRFKPQIPDFEFLLRTPLKCKTGSLAAPRFAHSICPGDAEKHRRRRAPQERCVNGVKILGPVESCLPPCASYFNSAFTSAGNGMQEKNSRNRPPSESASSQMRLSSGTALAVPTDSGKLWALAHEVRGEAPMWDL